jgi:hypothetical protein
MYLESLSLWDIVSGDTTQPQKPTILKEYLNEDGEFKDLKIEARIGAQSLTYNKWKANDAKARLVIVTSIPTTLVSQIQDLESAKEMLDLIIIRYDSEGPVQMLAHYTNWINCVWDGKGLDKFINKWPSLLAAANEANCDISNTVRTLQFINILSSSFPVWAATMRQEFRNGKVPDINDCINTVLDESKKKTDGNLINYNGYNKDSSNSNKTKPSNSNSNSQSTRDKCPCCGKSHTIDKCFHLHPELSTIAGFTPKKEWVDKYNQTAGKKNSKGGLMTMAVLPQLPALVLSTSQSWQKDMWIIDTGSCYHLCNNKAAFISLQNVVPLQVESANGSVYAHHKGTVQLVTVDTDGQHVTRQINDVYYAPTIPVSIISAKVLQFRTENVIIWMGDTMTFRMKTTNVEVMYTPLHSTLQLYCPKVVSVGDQQTLYTSDDDKQGTLALPITPTITSIDINVLHRRLGHAGWDSIRQLAKQLDYKLVGTQQFCETCQLTKAQQKISHQPQEKTTAVGDLIHCDTVGPLSTPGYRGEKYFLLLTDDYSGYRWGEAYTNKNDAFSALVRFLNFYLCTLVECNAKILFHE